jgi:hypothetical protein
MSGHSARCNNRVARWYIFKPKIQIWVIFLGAYNGRCWFILWPFGIHIYGHQLYLYLSVLVYCITNNLATLYVTSLVIQKALPNGISK